MCKFICSQYAYMYMLTLMKKLLLILICLILSSQSYGWELINKGPSTDTYIDKIKRSGDKGYFWSLFNNSDGTSFVVRFEVECISERMRDLTFMKYSNQNHSQQNYLVNF